MNTISTSFTFGTRRPVEEKWYTVKEICGICGVDLKTFTNFTKEITIGVDSIRYIMLGARHNVKTATYTESVLKQFQAWLLKNQANQGHSSSLVKQVATNAVVTELEEKWYTVKEICEACGVTDRTFIRFVKSVGVTGLSQRTRQDSTHAKEYPESVLLQFQAWLSTNNTNQNTNEVVLQVQNEVEEQGILVACVTNAGNINAANALCNLIMQKTKAVAQVKALEQQHTEDQKQIGQLQQALKYDKIGGWFKWRDEVQCKMKKPRPTFDMVADQLDLIEDEDYVKVVLGDDKFKTILVSPSATARILGN